MIREFTRVLETLAPMETIFDTNPKPMIVLNSQGNAVIANAAFYCLAEKPPIKTSKGECIFFVNDED